MNVERLSLLATVLEQQQLIANVGFNLPGWLEPERFNEISAITEERVTVGKHVNGYAVLDAARVSCGTTACAIGHAALIPEFQAQGLKLVRYASVEEVGDLGAMPYFDGKISWGAVNRFFDLEGSWSDYLFMSTSYDDDPLPSDVALRIRQLIADHAIGEG